MTIRERAEAMTPSGSHTMSKRPASYPIDGERFDIKAGVSTISGYSAHADQKDLLNFVKRMRRWPQTIRLVHGEQTARAALKAELESLYKRKGRSVTVRS